MFQNNKKIILIFVLLIVVIFVLFYSLGKSSFLKKAPQVEKSKEAEAPIQIVKEPGAEINVKIENRTFYPTSTKVKSGERVYLWIENTSEEEVHEIRWEKGIENVPPAVGMIGVNQKVLFTFYAPTSTGVYRLYCTIPEHNTDLQKESGEIFYLIVE